eukprot:947938_1
MVASTMAYKESLGELMMFGNSIFQKSDKLSDNVLVTVSNEDGTEMVRSHISKPGVLLLRDLVRLRKLDSRKPRFWNDLDSDMHSIILQFLSLQELTKLIPISREFQSLVEDSVRSLLAVSVTGTHPREYGVVMTLARRGFLSNLRSFSLNYNDIDAGLLEISKLIIQCCPKIKYFEPDIPYKLILNLGSPLEYLESNISGLAEVGTRAEYDKLSNLLPSLTLLNLETREIENNHMDIHPTDVPGLLQFVKSCTNLKSMSLNSWTARGVLSSLGTLQNLRVLNFNRLTYLGAPEHGLSRTCLGTLVENFPPNLEKMILVLVGTYYTESHIAMLVSKFKNVVRFHIQMLEDNTDMNSSPVATEPRDDGLNGLREVVLLLDSEVARQIFDQIEHFPLLQCTNLTLRQLSGPGPNEMFNEEPGEHIDDCLYAEIPLLSIGIPNVTDLTFSDSYTEFSSPALTRHFASMIKLQKIHLSSDVQLTEPPSWIEGKTLAKLILSIDSVTIRSRFLCFLLTYSPQIRVSKLVIIDDVPEKLEEMIHEAQWLSLTELTIDWEDTKHGALCVSRLTKLIAHMPALKKLKIRDCRPILCALDKIPENLRGILDFSDLKKIVGSLGLIM